MNKLFIIGLVSILLVVGVFFMAPHFSKQNAIENDIPVYVSEGNDKPNNITNHVKMYGNFSLLYKVDDDWYIFHQEAITGSVYFNGTEISDLAFYFPIYAELESPMDDITWNMYVSISINTSGDYVLGDNTYTFMKDNLGEVDTSSGVLNYNRTKSLLTSEDYVTLGELLNNGVYTGVFREDIEKYLAVFMTSNTSESVDAFNFNSIINFTYKFEAYLGDEMVSNMTNTLLYNLDLSSNAVSDSGEAEVASIFFESASYKINLDTFIWLGVISVGGVFLYSKYFKKEEKKRIKKSKRRSRR